MATPDPKTGPGGTGDDDTSLSNGAVAAIFATIAVLLVAGYLFVNKLVDISQEEDCALAHRHNCGASAPQ